MTLHRVANMGRHPSKVWHSQVVARNPAAIVGDLKILLAVGAATRDLDFGGPRINRVFNEFAHGFQGMRLRLRNDIDGVPLVADLQLSLPMLLPACIRILGHAPILRNTRKSYMSQATIS